MPIDAMKNNKQIREQKLIRRGHWIRIYGYKKEKSQNSIKGKNILVNI